MAKSGIKLGPADLSLDVPLSKKILVAKCGTNFGLADLSSAVSPVEVYSGQEWYNVRSA